MTGNDWFPWYFDRVRKSKWWRRASDMARARNVMLWGEAYKGIPAGSLPDDDDELAEAAGFGMEVEAFLAVKAEIMAAWTLCSDGRWYHPTVCEIVLEVWEKASERRKAAAKKKADQRAKARGQGGGNANVPDETPDVPRDTAENGGDIHTQEKTGQERTGKGDANASLSPESGDDRPPMLALVADTGPPPDPIRQAFEAWNALAVRLDLPRAKTLEEGRRKAIKARLAVDGLAGWTEALGAVERSRHCRGENDRNWRADLDFVCQPKSFRKLREGSYGNDAPVAAPAGAPTTWTGPPEVRTAVVDAKGEDWAVGYLDRMCRWRDVPERAVVSGNGFVVDTLRKEVGRPLAELGVKVLMEEGRAA